MLLPLKSMLSSCSPGRNPKNFSTMFSNSQHPEWGATESQGVRNTDNTRPPYIHPYTELRLVEAIEKFLCLLKTWYPDSFLRKCSRTRVSGLMGFLFWFGDFCCFKNTTEVVPTPTFNIRYGVHISVWTFRFQLLPGNSVTHITHLINESSNNQPHN